MTRDPITRALDARRQKIPDIPQDALFDLDPASQPGSEVAKKKQPTAKTIRSMPCPECMAKKVGVIRTYDPEIGQHVETLKRHDRITRKGHHFKCSASGRRVDE